MLFLWNRDVLTIDIFFLSSAFFFFSFERFCSSSKALLTGVSVSMTETRLRFPAAVPFLGLALSKGLTSSGVGNSLTSFGLCDVFSGADTSLDVDGIAGIS